MNIKSLVIKNIIHPHRLKRLASMLRYIYKFQTNGNSILIENIESMTDCRMASKGYANTIVIANGGGIRGMSVTFTGNNGTLLIGKDVCINARNSSRVAILISDNQTVEIGDGCLFSDGILMCTTDFHQVIDRETGQRTNNDASIRIGENCWIGRRVSIGKGVSIAANSVVGSNSVVTKTFEEPNVLIAGNPAQIKKRNIDWRY